MNPVSSLNENAQKWVRALRSGLFKQGQGYLQTEDINGNNYFCCLGVACELAILDGVNVEKWKDGDHFKYEMVSDLLPPYKVMDWLGLRTTDGQFDEAIMGHNNLTELNDSAEWTFEQIADFVESDPAGLFRVPVSEQ